jgi:hypothetical protein
MISNANSDDPIAAAEAQRLSALSLPSLLSQALEWQNKVTATRGRIASIRAEALANACSMGHLLLAIKRKLPHGQFGIWIKGSTLEVSQKTAERYMGLAEKSSHVANLPSGTSLRKAYVSLGIIESNKLSPIQTVLAEVLKLRISLSKLESIDVNADGRLLEKEVQLLKDECSGLIDRRATSQSSRKARRQKDDPFLDDTQIRHLAFSLVSSRSMGLPI